MRSYVVDKWLNINEFCPVFLSAGIKVILQILHYRGSVILIVYAEIEGHEIVENWLRARLSDSMVVVTNTGTRGKRRGGNYD